MGNFATAGSFVPTGMQKRITVTLLHVVKNAMGCLFFWVQIPKGLCVYVLNWHNTNIYENDSVI